MKKGRELKAPFSFASSTRLVRQKVDRRALKAEDFEEP